MTAQVKPQPTSSRHFKDFYLMIFFLPYAFSSAFYIPFLLGILHTLLEVYFSYILSFFTLSSSLFLSNLVLYDTKCHFFAGSGHLAIHKGMNTIVLLINSCVATPLQTVILTINDRVCVPNQEILSSSRAGRNTIVLLINSCVVTTLHNNTALWFLH